MNIQRKIASKILKCGIKRVWLDPKRLEDIGNAITRNDVKALINDGLIKKVQDAGISSGRRSKVLKQKKKGRRSGIGKRKGSHSDKKARWIKKIRALRKYLAEFKEKGAVTNQTFRKLYRISSSGYFKNKNHLKAYVEKNNLLIAKEKK